MHVELQYERLNKSMSLPALREQYVNNTGLPDLAAIGGLAKQEAQHRLKQEGYNELPASRKRSLLTIAFDVVREPMFLLLLAAGTIYMLLGDVREALVLIGSILVIMGITLYQEQKTERALEALRDLSSPRALVIRGGEQQRIAGRDVVRGDLVMLAEGDRVPADGILLWRGASNVYLQIRLLPVVLLVSDSSYICRK
jgi:Ca2+-transporting ATPase